MNLTPNLIETHSVVSGTERADGRLPIMRSFYESYE
jgi:hypothetical protein